MCRAVQVDPTKPTLKAPGTKRLKLKCVEPLSDVAFNFNLRRYTAPRAVPRHLLSRAGRGVIENKHPTDVFLLPVPPRVCMFNHPQRKSHPNPGRALVLNDPPAWPRRPPTAAGSSRRRRCPRCATPQARRASPRLPPTSRACSPAAPPPLLLPRTAPRQGLPLVHFSAHPKPFWSVNPVVSSL